MSPRILVTISRKWNRWTVVRSALEQIHAQYPDAILVHGDCPDGDRTAAGIWKSLGGTDEPWPADWRHFGRAAGFRRNAAMVESNPDLTIAFIANRSAGASHCYNLAAGAGLNVREPYRQED